MKVLTKFSFKVMELFSELIVVDGLFSDASFTFYLHLAASVL